MQGVAFGFKTSFIKLRCVYLIHCAHVQIEPMIGKQMQTTKTKWFLKSCSLIVVKNPCTHSLSNKEFKVSMLFIEVYAYVLLTSNGAIDY
jgi:hypothetical protein